MLSTPPAIIRSASPDLIARAAVPSASSPEPHRRFTVEPGTSSGKSGEQRRHARDVAVVLAGLVGAAEDHVVHGLPVDPRLRAMQRGDRNGTEVVGSHRRQCATVAAKGSANGVADKGMAGHGSSLFVSRVQSLSSSTRAAASPITGRRQFDQLVAEFGVGQWQFGVALAVGLEVGEGAAVAQRHFHARGTAARETGVDLGVDHRGDALTSKPGWPGRRAGRFVGCQPDAAVHQCA